MLEFFVLLLFVSHTCLSCKLGTRILTVDEVCARCECNNSSVRCSGLRLNSLNVDRQQDWSWVHSFDLSRNDFRAVPDLSMFRNLIDLNMKGNMIDKLRVVDLKGLHQLRTLNIDDNLITFSPDSIQPEIFTELHALQTIRMKQRVAPDIYADYQFLVRVNSTLKHLYMTGVPELSDYFSQLTHLQTLSLGGPHCNITELMTETYSAIGQLPLQRFSARHCGIRRIDIRFLRFFNLTLKKLDLSCNPLFFYGNLSLTYLLEDFRGSKLTTLIVDYINHQQESCDLSYDKTIDIDSLLVFSFQANHIINWTGKINMPFLRYLNIAQNTFGGAAFNILQQTQCKSGCSFWKSVAHSLRFFGLDAITQSLTCGEYKPELLSCDLESELFENDHFEWNKVDNPDYFDPLAAADFFEDAETDIMIYLHNQTLPKNNLVSMFLEVLQQHHRTNLLSEIIVALLSQDIDRAVSLLCQRDNQIVPVELIKKWKKRYPRTYEKTLSDSSIDWKVRDQCTEEKWKKLVLFAKGQDPSYRFFVVNATTIQMTENSLQAFRVENLICNDITILYNNMKTMNASNSKLGFMGCGNITGLDSLENVIASNCQIYGWNTTLLLNLPALTTLDLSKNMLGTKLREDPHVFQMISGLKTLLLGEQAHGIKCFNHQTTIAELKNIETLDLYKNMIEVWNISLVNNTNIKLLNLSYNSISCLDGFYLQDIEEAHKKSNLIVDLRGNPYSCDCAPTAGAISNIRIQSYDFILMDPLQCKIQNESPASNKWLIVAGVACASFIFGIIGFITFAKKKKQLKSMETMNVFISYSDNMASDIAELEVSLIRFNITLVRSNLGELGISHSQNLSSIISVCAKCTLVLDEKYFTENCTNTDFRLIESSGMLVNGKTILLLRSVNIASLPSSVRQLIDEDRFLVWPDCYCGTSDGLAELAHKLNVMCRQSIQSDSHQIYGTF